LNREPTPDQLTLGGEPPCDKKRLFFGLCTTAWGVPRVFPTAAVSQFAEVLGRPPPGPLAAAPHLAWKYVLRPIRSVCAWWVIMAASQAASSRAPRFGRHGALAETAGNLRHFDRLRTC